MKKILFSLTILLSTLLFATNVNASSFNANIVGNDTFESEITLYIQVDDLEDFSGTCNGLCGLVGNLNYDTDKIELISIDALEDFALTQGKTLVLYKTNGVESGTKVLSMKFKNKSLAKDESTTITLSNIVASDGDKDITTDDISKTIKFIVKENTTNNNSNINDKKEELEKSSNNYLSTITLSNGNIKFDKNILIYDVVVDYDVTFIEINALLEDEKAIVTGIGKHDLNVGKNVIKLTIKAEDESERIYTININREEKDVIVDNEKEMIDNEDKTKENNYVIPIVIISLLIIGIIIAIIYNKNK